MKISFLLFILGFSQVLGQNYGSSTESKYEREDQPTRIMTPIQRALMPGWKSSPPKTECRNWFIRCSSDEDCNQCSDCPNGAYCEPTESGRDPGFNVGFKAGEKSFSCECLDENYEYDNSMDYFN